MPQTVCSFQISCNHNYCPPPPLQSSFSLSWGKWMWAKMAAPFARIKDSTWTAKNTLQETKRRQRQPFLHHMDRIWETVLGPYGRIGSKMHSGCPPTWLTLWQVHVKSVDSKGFPHCSMLGWHTVACNQYK